MPSHAYYVRINQGKPTMSTCPVPMSTVASVLATVLPLKGQFVAIEWEREAKTLKRSNPPAILKRTKAVVRFGVNYDNIARVKEGREDGTLPAENPGMSWGTWVEGCVNYLKEHNGKYYLRCTIIHNDACKPKVAWTANGEAVEKDSILDFLASSEKQEHTGEVFDLCLNNLLTLNKVEVPQ